MRIWLDDIRHIPKGFDLWFKNGKDLLDYIRLGKPITFVSFDHDLTTDHYVGSYIGEVSGYDVASHIEMLAYSNEIPRFEWTVHSANPSGAKRIVMAMNNADRYWSEHERRQKSKEDTKQSTNY